MFYLYGTLGEGVTVGRDLTAKQGWFRKCNHVIVFFENVATTYKHKKEKSIKFFSFLDGKVFEFIQAAFTQDAFRTPGRNNLEIEKRPLYVSLKFRRMH